MGSGSEVEHNPSAAAKSPGAFVVSTRLTFPSAPRAPRLYNSWKLHRCTRALPPLTSASTSLSDAMEVSPGVVIASAPCAVPYSTAFCGSSNFVRPYSSQLAKPSPCNREISHQAGSS